MTRLPIATVSLIAISLILVFQSDARISQDNIMAMWLFNEGQDDVATDSSPNGNDGTINGAEWVDGKFGRALSFDGVDDWVEVPHSPTVGFPAGTSFTITLYFKGTRVGGSLVGKNYEDTSQTLPWYLLWDDGSRNQVTLYLRDGAGTSFRADGTSVVADDEWHFIAGRADADEGLVSIWIDGEKESEVGFNTESDYGTTEGVLHIARHYDRYTTGIIDDVGLFNVALDESDMEAIMNGGLDVVTAVEPYGKLTTTWGGIKEAY